MGKTGCFFAGGTGGAGVSGTACATIDGTQFWCWLKEEW